MFNIFGKKKSKKLENRENVKTVDVQTQKIEKVETIEPERINLFEMKYRDNATGEIHTFDSRDFEAFNKIMSRKDVTLIFG